MPTARWGEFPRRPVGPCRVPKSRFNLAGHYSDAKRLGTVEVEYGYFLDETVDLAGVDTSFTVMGRSELEMLDPQQRLLLEFVREALHDAGTTGVAGSATGVYIGSLVRTGTTFCGARSCSRTSTPIKAQTIYYKDSAGLRLDSDRKRPKDIILRKHKECIKRATMLCNFVRVNNL